MLVQGPYAMVRAELVEVAQACVGPCKIKYARRHDKKTKGSIYVIKLAEFKRGGWENIWSIWLDY